MRMFVQLLVCPVSGGKYRLQREHNCFIYFILNVNTTLVYLNVVDQPTSKIWRADS